MRPLGVEFGYKYRWPGSDAAAKMRSKERLPMRQLLLLLVVSLSLPLSPGALVAQKPASIDAHADPFPDGAIAQIGTTRYRVRNHLACRLAPDGSALAVNVPIDGITVWQLPAWSRYRTIGADIVDPERTASFRSQAFTPDSKKLVLFDANTEQILAYDLAAGRITNRSTLPVAGPFHDASISIASDQKTFVFTWDETRSLKQAFLVCDLNNGAVQHTLRLAFDRLSPDPQFAIAPDGRRLIRNGTHEAGKAGACALEIWDLASGKAVRSIEIDSPMTKLLCSPDSKTLLAIDRAGALRNFDLEAGKERPNKVRNPGNLLAFSPDSSCFYLGQEGGDLVCRSTADSEIKAAFACPVRSETIQLAFPGVGKVLALGVNRTTLYYWNVREKNLLSPIDVPCGPITQLAFSSPNELFVAANNGHAAWWNARTGRKVSDLRLADPETKTPLRLDPHSLSLGAGGDVIATADGGLAFFDAKSGQFLHAKKGIADKAPLCFFDSGKKVAVLDGKTVRIWHARSGKEQAAFEIRLPPVGNTGIISASSDGKILAIAQAENAQPARNWVSLWDTDTRRVLTDEHPVSNFAGLAVSPDARWYGLNETERLVLSRVGTANADARRELSQQWREISCFAFSPDGRHLAYAAHVPLGSPLASRIYIYEMASKQIRLELPGHPACVAHRLTYSSDGLLASAAADGDIFMWQVGLAAFG
jgi:WD40 repeat protein